MKKKYFIPALLLLSAVSVLGLRGEAQAAKKQAVKVQVKKGTLTISGKGAMPSKLNVKKKSKIKKVVIKKGVTSISNHAFENYKNLKTVSIPKTVKKIGWDSFCKTAIQKLTVPSSVTSIGQNAFSSMSKLKKLTVPGKFTVKTKVKRSSVSWYVCEGVDTVAFNTNLTLENSVAFICNHFEAYKKDTNYTSIDGILYSKDKKTIVRVPKMRETVEIANGCEIFSLQSILATNIIVDDGEEISNDYINYKKIIIPESVKQVEVKKYAGKYMIDINKQCDNKIKLEIRSRQLDGASLCELRVWLRVTIDSLQKILPGQIQKKDNMYISSDGVLMNYIGEEEKIMVPEYIKKVGPYAFCNREMKLLKLPEGLTEVGDYAFYQTGNRLEDKGLVVNFPSSLRVIGERAFASSSIKKLSLPDTITSYGNYAFENSSITEVEIPKTVKVISKGLFFRTPLKKIVIPDWVEKIESSAFEDCDKVTEIKIGKAVKEIGNFAFGGVEVTDIILPESVEKIGVHVFGNSCNRPRNITISGSSKGIDNEAFCTLCDRLFYAKSIKEMRTFFDSRLGSLANKKASFTFSCNKVKGASGYQTIFSTDKNFKKNTKKMTFRKSGTKKTVVLHLKKSQIKKGKYREGATIYGKIRPYKTVDGKKVYGTWTSEEFKCWDWDD